jgi:hypothetical protein
MTPRQKAEKLVNEFYRIIPLDKMTIDCNLSKKCALIAVDEILDLKHIEILRRNMHEMELDFWDEVKQEIESL